MTDDPRAAAFEMSDEALKAAMLNHGVDCRRWKAMPAALASSNCAECGMSARAHVVTKLIDYIYSLRNLRAAPDADPLARKEANDYHRMYDEVTAERDALREELAKERAKISGAAECI